MSGEMVDEKSTVEWLARKTLKSRGLDPDKWENYAPFVRGILNVLREPNAAMVLAGSKRIRQHGTAFQVFRAMIDKALEK